MDDDAFCEYLCANGPAWRIDEHGVIGAESR
jgi:hypothetical protein